MNEQARFQLSEDVTYQSMGGDEETVMLSLSSGYLYTCNETTKSFIGALDGERTFGEVVDLLTAQYDIPREQLLSDLETMLEELLREKLIVLADSDGDDEQAGEKPVRP